jgi:hypothetical protein
MKKPIIFASRPNKVAQHLIIISSSVGVQVMAWLGEDSRSSECHENLNPRNPASPKHLIFC